MHAILILALTANVNHPTVHLKGGIVAYEAVLSTRLPPEVWTMSNSEYYRFAIRWNEKAILANRTAAYQQTGHTRYATATDSASSGQTRFGGGVGAGGYGGAGGYDGYLAGEQGGGAGFGFGASRPGNAMSVSWDSAAKSYVYEYEPWPVWNGGDVELLNPFCKPKRHH